MPEDDIGLKVRIETEADASGLTDAQQAIQGAGTDVKGLSGDFRTATRSGYEFGLIMRGLERGGVGGAMTAVRGLRGLLATLGPAFVTSAGVMAPVIAAVAIGLVELKRRAKENEEAMQAMWAGAENRAKSYKAAVEAIQKAADAMTKDFLADLDEINRRMKEMDANAAMATKHFDELRKSTKERADAETELAKQRELSAAKTPAERAEIEARYGAQAAQTGFAGEANQVENDRLNAQNDKKNATNRILEADETMRAAQLQAENAKKEFENATVNAGEALAAGGTPEYVAGLQEHAKELKAKAEALAKTVETTGAEVGKIMDEANKKIGEADIVLENLANRRAAISAKGAAAGIAAGRKEAGLLVREESPLTGEAAKLEREKASLEGELETMSAGRLTSGRLTSGTEYEQADATKAKLDDTQRALDILNSSIGDFATAAARKMRKTSGQLVNQRDQAPTVY